MYIKLFRKKSETEILNAEVERINNRDWKKAFELEEKHNLEIERSNAKFDKERENIRRKVREGPLWKRLFKKGGGFIVKESKAEIQRWKTKPKTRKTKTKSKKTKKESVK